VRQAAVVLTVVMAATIQKVLTVTLMEMGIPAPVTIPVLVIPSSTAIKSEVDAKQHQHRNFSVPVFPPLKFDSFYVLIFYCGYYLC
jgi:urea transporter